MRHPDSLKYYFDSENHVQFIKYCFCATHTQIEWKLYMTASGAMKCVLYVVYTWPFSCFQSPPPVSEASAVSTEHQRCWPVNSIRGFLHICLVLFCEHTGMVHMQYKYLPQ